LSTLDELEKTYLGKVSVAEKNIYRIGTWQATALKGNSMRHLFDAANLVPASSQSSFVV
jgi:hypothetical protein